ncbi:hypothetical protein MUP38_05180 [Candidatus Bathyarchaeota archaeon]|nr:hypothetical protein [Candidatus Bathyarchaeota archaeon]
MLQAITKRLKRGKRGISTVIVIMLSLVLVVVIVSNVVLWSYQMNQVDMDRIQETLSLTNVERPRSPWFTAQNEFSISAGSILSGTYADTASLDELHETFYEEAQQGSDVYSPLGYRPVGSTSYVSGSVADLSSNNGVYMNFRSNASGTSNNNFYPSSYALSGSTRTVSGALADLQADDGGYMTYRSYVSASSATSKTEAFIAYRSNTSSGLSFPKNRLWDGDTDAWGSESEMATAGSDIRWVRTAVCPISERALEKIVVTLSDDGYLNAYVWDGTSWNVTNYIGYVGTPANAYKCFDITYETTSGKALLVYGISSTDTARDLAYKTWTFGTGWSSEYYIDDTEHTTNIQYYWVELASNPTSGSNEVTMVALDGTDSDGNGWVWNVSSWGSIYELDGTVSTTTRECVAVAYESQSGRAWTAVGSGSNASMFSMRSQTGGIWNATKESPNVGGTPYWCTLKSDPASNQLMLTSVDSGSDLNTVYWSGDGDWSAPIEHDASVDYNAYRCADFAWEPTGGKGLLVWGTASGSISRKTFTAPSTWGSAATVNYTGTKAWIQLRTNTRTVGGDAKILGAVLNSAFDIGAISWDGTAFTIISEATFTAGTTAVTYECFEMEYNIFGDPTEFTSEFEFTGASNTESWTQLTWTIDSSSTTADTNAVLQLYNYHAGQYPTSGDGYMTGTVGTDDVTMSQNITANPTYFRDGSGNWAMKIKIVKATAQQFDWKGDLASFTTPHTTGYTCEVEFSGTSDTQSWMQLDWTADLSFTTPDVTTTLQLYNYAASRYPTSGDGYITGTLGQTDVTKNQTITANPTNFRDTNGNWTMKIRGTKATDTPFELKIDWIEFKTIISKASRLDIDNNFTIDPSTCPRDSICGIEIQTRYNVTGNTERWFLKAYNWATSNFTDIGFNNTAGDAPTLNGWNDYAIIVMADWTDYVRSDGVVRIEFVDQRSSIDQATVEIDFCGARAIMDGACINIKNSSPLSIHIVALWITNSTSHQHYDTDLFLNSGESTEYIREDLSLPQDVFIVKVITERGNIAVFASG